MKIKVAHYEEHPVHFVKVYASYEPRLWLDPDPEVDWNYYRLDEEDIPDIRYDVNPVCDYLRDQGIGQLGIDWEYMIWFDPKAREVVVTWWEV